MIEASSVLQSREHIIGSMSRKDSWFSIKLVVEGEVALMLVKSTDGSEAMSVLLLLASMWALCVSNKTGRCSLLFGVELVAMKG